MGRIEPDMSVFRQMQKQPEFNEQIWQYINRRVSDWRIINGREGPEEARGRCSPGSSRNFGVERGTLLALWGVERSEPMAIPWCSRTICARSFPRSPHSPWKRAAPPRLLGTELINALKIVDRGWGTPEEMRGSWGRRDGPYAMDAGSLAQCRHGL